MTDEKLIEQPDEPGETFAPIDVDTEVPAEPTPPEVTPDTPETPPTEVNPYDAAEEREASREEDPTTAPIDPAEDES